LTKSDVNKIMGLKGDPMIGIYARVSSLEQQKNTSLERQQREGVTFANKRNEPYRLYIEAKSGASLRERKELHRLIADIEDGTITTVWELLSDRLSRDADNDGYLISIMKRKGIVLYVGERRTDPKNWRELFTHRIEAAVAEMDLAQRAERTTAGLHTRMDAGQLRTRRLYGYQRQHNPDGTVTFEIDPDQAAIIKRVFDMDAKGTSYCRIAFTLTGEKQESPTGAGKWPAPTVRRMLANPHYAGLTYNATRELVPSKIYPAIIDAVTWKRAQRQHVVQRINLYSRQNAHLASGLLRCAICGELYHYSLASTHGGRFRYKNYCHDYHGERCHGSTKRILLWWVDAVFKIVYLTSIRDMRAISKLYAKEAAQIDRQKEQIERDVKRTSAKIEELSTRKQRLVSAIARGVIDEGDAGEEVGKIKTEIMDLEKAKVASRRDLLLKQDHVDLVLREFGADNFHKFLEEGGVDEEGKVIHSATTDRERRDMISRIVESATIEARQITIKVVSGKTFTLTYAPRDEEEAVKYLARQGGVDLDLLSENTLTGLLAAVVRQGADSATAVYLEAMDVELHTARGRRNSPVPATSGRRAIYEGAGRGREDEKAGHRARDAGAGPQRDKTGIVGGSASGDPFDGGGAGPEREGNCGPAPVGQDNSFSLAKQGHGVHEGAGGGPQRTTSYRLC
jgi:DNA invertase Pin-like site-specific DNA recombinase